MVKLEARERRDGFNGRCLMTGIGRIAYWAITVNKEILATRGDRGRRSGVAKPNHRSPPF